MGLSTQLSPLSLRPKLYFVFWQAKPPSGREARKHFYADKRMLQEIPAYQIKGITIQVRH
ncbi:MAG: hypothetical protein HOP26_08485, partial [Methylotenera sp.]|nr:hypothetical protein [Methylotenera sp.]